MRGVELVVLMCLVLGWVNLLKEVKVQNFFDGMILLLIMLMRVLLVVEFLVLIQYRNLLILVFMNVVWMWLVQVIFLFCLLLLQKVYGVKLLVRFVYLVSYVFFVVESGWLGGDLQLCLLIMLRQLIVGFGLVVRLVIMFF